LAQAAASLSFAGAGASLAFAALGLGACLARDKRGIAVELKGKREDQGEILPKRAGGER